LGKLIEEAADQEVLGHGPISVQQDYGTPLASGDVVDPHPVHFDKPARRLMGLLGPQILHRLAGPANGLTALPHSGSGCFGGGPQDLGDPLCREAMGSAPRGPPVDTWEQGDSQGCGPARKDRTLLRERKEAALRGPPANRSAIMPLLLDWSSLTFGLELERIWVFTIGYDALRRRMRSRFSHAVLSS